LNTSTILKKLFATFPNGNATAATVLVYVERLSSIPEDELEAVINQCIDESEFLPTIAKLKEMHRLMKSPVTPDMAQQGWESVTKAIAGVGMWGTPAFKDPIVKRVVDAFGWLNLCMSDNQMADRAQFVKFYESFARQVAEEERLSSDYKRLREQHRTQTQIGESHNGLVQRIEG
jgi:hypothetical protein